MEVVILKSKFYFSFNEIQKNLFGVEKFSRVIPELFPKAFEVENKFF